MTVTPGASSDPLTIRLYDKIEEMRSDVASMASDVRNLATTIQPVVTQVGDHEGRVRTLEKESATKEELEALTRQVQDLQRGRWKTAGAAAAGSLVASSGVLALIATKVLGH